MRLPILLLVATTLSGCLLNARIAQTNVPLPAIKTGPSGAPLSKTPAPRGSRMEEELGDASTGADELPPPGADGSYAYSLATKIRVNSNCGGASGDRAVVEGDGSFRWTDNLTPDLPAGERMLTAEEQKTLRDELLRLDPVRKLRGRASSASLGGGSSGGCSMQWLTVLTLEGGREVAFGGNTDADEAAFEIAKLLRTFASAQDDGPATGGGVSYQFPLVAKAIGECGMGEIELYRVADDQTFTWSPVQRPLRPNEAAVAPRSRKLTMAEMAQVLQAVGAPDADLASMASFNNELPPGGMQTDDCKVSRAYTVVVNGKTRTYTANARNMRYAEPYLAAVKRLDAALAALAATEPEAEPTATPAPTPTPTLAP